MLETAVRPQEFYSIHRLYTLCVIGIRVIVLSILIPVRAIFVAPYGCSWANQYLASPNMLSVSLYRAWFIHTFLFTGKAMFIHSLERDDFFIMYTQYYFIDYAVSYIFFTQKWASLYSSFWIRFSSPQASGKETTLLSLPTLSTYQLIMLHNNISVINATPVVTRRPFPLWLV